MKGFARTAWLMAGMTALVTGLGGLLGGPQFALGALAVATIGNGIAYWKSDKIVLSQYGAREITAQSSPELLGIVKDIAAKAGIPTPKTYIIESDQPNAFATGRNPENGVVALSTGLLKTMPMPQVAGVIAHEIAHIKNRDTLTMTVAASMAGAISLLTMFAPRDAEGRPNIAAGLLLGILAPIGAGLVKMAISRSREYEADKMGAELSRPEWLADALETLSSQRTTAVNHRSEQHPETAHMFIVNPLLGGGIDRLFSTHPSTEERVRRLRAMAPSQ